MSNKLDTVGIVPSNADRIYRNEGGNWAVHTEIEIDAVECNPDGAARDACIWHPVDDREKIFAKRRALEERADCGVIAPRDRQRAIQDRVAQADIAARVLQAPDREGGGQTRNREGDVDSIVQQADVYGHGLFVLLAGEGEQGAPVCQAQPVLARQLPPRRDPGLLQRARQREGIVAEDVEVVSAPARQREPVSIDLRLAVEELGTPLLEGRVREEGPNSGWPGAAEAERIVERRHSEPDVLPAQRLSQASQRRRLADPQLIGHWAEHGHLDDGVRRAPFSVVAAGLDANSERVSFKLTGELRVAAG